VQCVPLIFREFYVCGGEVGVLLGQIGVGSGALSWVGGVGGVAVDGVGGWARSSLRWGAFGVLVVRRR
jgi:hypothetical protein